MEHNSQLLFRQMPSIDQERAIMLNLGFLVDNFLLGHTGQGLSSNPGLDKRLLELLTEIGELTLNRAGVLQGLGF